MFKWLIDNLSNPFLILLVLALVMVLGDTKTLRGKVEKLTTDNTTLKSDLEQAHSDLTSLRNLQNKNAENDKRMTKELADAKNVITQLERDVAGGNRRMRINAKCPSQSSTTSSVDDGNTARLTDSAQRDYFTLRERAEQSRIMILGLQAYIRDVCL